MTSPVPGLFLISVLFLLKSQEGDGFDWCGLKCNNEPHTMCAYKAGGPPECSGASHGMSDAEKQVVLKEHNELRNKVASGKEPSQPAASDMYELLWDDELAEVAQRWIDQCQFKLEHDKCRNSKDGENVGQNLAWMWSSKGVTERESSLKGQVHGWYDEVKLFDKSYINRWWDTKEPWWKFGHYTQLVWAATTHVGCGVYSNAKSGEFKLACNYKPAGNMREKPVYTVGETAAKCKTKSKNYPGLCSP